MDDKTWPERDSKRRDTTKYRKIWRTMIAYEKSAQRRRAFLCEYIRKIDKLN